jgi:hypothetical protein
MRAICYSWRAGAAERSNARLASANRRDAMRVMKPAAFAAIAALGLLSASAAQATKSVVKPMSESDIKSFCDRVEGDFTRAPDGSGYACRNECNGGDCSVTCSKDNYCIIETPESRVATGSFDPKADGFLKLAIAEDDRDGERNDAGWLGLLGLAGLAGLLGVRRATERPRTP